MRAWASSRLNLRPEWVLVVMCALVLAVGGVFYTWQRYQYVRLGFEVAELRERKAQLEAEMEPLEVEARYLSRLARIHELATQKLGMREPRPGQVIVVEGDGAVRRPD